MTKIFSEYYCKDSFIDVVLPTDLITLDESKDWLIIGHPGVDGIEFRVKADLSDNTVYAFYPMDNEYIKVADSVDHLILKWKAREISV